jgi:uncharacterized protein (DUF2249 family)
MTTSCLPHHPWSPADEVELDVRDELRQGGEPFARIMAAVAALAPRQVLHLRAIFEPVPLVRLLGERGYAAVTHAHASDDWSAWFYRADEAPAAPDAPDACQCSCGLPDAAPAASAAFAAPTIELDVRLIPPREKHPSIFRTFDGLAPAEAMVIVNDHDPRPLRYQLLAERPDTFEWTYLEEGPEVWRVRIDRR